MQYACAILWPIRLYEVFPHYLINSMIFEKKMLLNIKCVFLFSVQILSEKFLILRNAREMIKNVKIGFHVKCRLLLSDFSET